MSFEIETDKGRAEAAAALQIEGLAMVRVLNGAPDCPSAYASGQWFHSDGRVYK